MSYLLNYSENLRAEISKKIDILSVLGPYQTHKEKQCNHEENNKKYACISVLIAVLQVSQPYPM